MNSVNYINYYEDVKRGTDDFPIEFYHLTESHPRYLMELHWHVDFEFIRVLEGNLLLTLNGKTFDMQKGMAAFIPSGLLHSATPLNNCVYDCAVLGQNMYYPEACWKRIKEIQKHEREVQSIYDSKHSQMCRHIWNLFDAYIEIDEPGLYELMVRGALYSCLALALNQYTQSEVPANTPQSIRRINQIKQALEFIENSYTLPLTLDQLAANVGMSRKYFCKFFKEMTQHSPIDYLNHYRIERACDLLRISNKSFIDIAEDTGFHDLSYFIKMFKKYKGITPKQYQLHMKE